ncbi:hypothetical protein BC2926_38730 [Bacillus cereus]|nr:hypothetical protein BC2926_38730 [Bacillus cereus]
MEDNRCYNRRKIYYRKDRNLPDARFSEYQTLILSYSKDINNEEVRESYKIFNLSYIEDKNEEKELNELIDSFDSSYSKDENDTEAIDALREVSIYLIVKVQKEPLSGSFFIYYKEKRLISFDNGLLKFL